MSLHKRQHSIMFVDDERWALLGISNIIDWSYYNFKIVAQEDNPHHALATIAERKPDAVLVDIRMPGMSGIELMRASRISSILSFVSFIFMGLKKATNKT